MRLAWQDHREGQSAVIGLTSKAIAVAVGREASEEAGSWVASDPRTVPGNGSFSGEMMKVYELTLAEGQEWAMPKVLEDNNVLSDLRGERQPHWTPIQMDLLTEDDEGTPRGYSDFPWYGAHVLILRSDAANGLRKAMTPYGEFLPLKGVVGLELFNATTVVDALDEDRSEIIRFDDGDILNIERYVFRREAIADRLIFKLPYRASNLYFQAEFIDQIKDMECCGVGFKLVWSDETDPVGEIILPPRERPLRRRRWWPAGWRRPSA